MISPTPETKKLLEEFPFRYIGGGYYRNTTVPIGEPAETLHGDQILARFAEHVLEVLNPTLPALFPSALAHLDCIARDHCQSHQETTQQ